MKKEYYLKLRLDFFSEPAVDLILNESSGCMVIVTYIRMLLDSLPTGELDISDTGNKAEKYKISHNDFIYALHRLSIFQLIYINGNKVQLPYITKHTVGRESSSRNRNTQEYKIWRNSVFVRDDYTCQKCRQRGKKLNAHHIKSWRDYPELRYSVENGLTLCEECHKKEHKRRI